MRTKSVLIVPLFLFLGTGSPGYSQNQIITSKSDDAFKELEDSSLTLRFMNALNGQSIPNATVTVESAGTVTTDVEGRAYFRPPFSNGRLNVDFQCAGYVASSFNVEIRAGSLFFNRFSISPNLLHGAIRIVLDWGGEPQDLDAHLVKTQAYHISFRDMKASSDGKVTLDHDAMHGYGPETITINSIDQDGQYSFFVHNYSDMRVNNSQALSESKGSVKVYGSNGLSKIYQVPTSQSGLVWNVFRIEHADLVDVNTIEN